MSNVYPLIRSERDVANYIGLSLEAPAKMHPGEWTSVTAILRLDEDIPDRDSLGMLLRTEERKNWKGHIDLMIACNIGKMKDFSFDEDVFDFTYALLTHHHFRFSDAHELFKDNGVYQFRHEFMTPYKAGVLDYDIIGVRARLRDKPTYDESTWDDCAMKFIEVSRKMQPIGSVPDDNVCQLRQRA